MDDSWCLLGDSYCGKLLDFAKAGPRLAESLAAGPRANLSRHPRYTHTLIPAKCRTVLTHEDDTMHHYEFTRSHQNGQNAPSPMWMRL